jgi:hypothetical protein
MPDYANNTAIASLPWTANKTGYVVVGGEGMHGPGNINYSIGGLAFNYYHSANVYLSLYRLLPISKGDVLSTATTGAWGSGGPYHVFIPIKWVDVEED